MARQIGQSLLLNITNDAYYKNQNSMMLEFKAN